MEKGLHFKDIVKTTRMNSLAEMWTRLFCRNSINTYFYLFGVNRSNVNKQLWVDKETKHFKIYNKFFEIGLNCSMGWFFYNKVGRIQKLKINNIFSDLRSKKEADDFCYRPIKNINFKKNFHRDKIEFLHNKVIEIDSNHERSNSGQHSHAIQYVDLILGIFSQILDNTSSHEFKHKLANILMSHSLPKDIMGYRNNHFISKYYKRYGLSFFPKEKIDSNLFFENNSQGMKSYFFNERELLYVNDNSLKLFN